MPTGFSNFHLKPFFYPLTPSWYTRLYACQDLQICKLILENWLALTEEAYHNSLIVCLWKAVMERSESTMLCPMFLQ